MPATATPHDSKRGGVRGRRLWALGKQKKSAPQPIKLRPVTVDNDDIEASFQACAFPSAVEIFKLSEKTDFAAAKIKSEFKVRRQAFRLRYKMPEDSVFDASAVPRLILLLSTLCSCLMRSCTQQAMAELTVLAISMISIWCSKNAAANHDLQAVVGHLIPFVN